jgi:hypothetical protein
MNIFYIGKGLVNYLVYFDNNSCYDLLHLYPPLGLSEMVENSTVKML